MQGNVQNAKLKKASFIPQGIDLVCRQIRTFLLWKVCWWCWLEDEVEGTAAIGVMLRLSFAAYSLGGLLLWASVPTGWSVSTSGFASYYCRGRLHFLWRVIPALKVQHSASCLPEHLKILARAIFVTVAGLPAAWDANIPYKCHFEFWLFHFMCLFTPQMVATVTAGSG